MESPEQTGSYSYPPIALTGLFFGKGLFFHLLLSEYANQSHHFTNLNFCDATLLFSVGYFMVAQETG